ncbi:GNAT family N-acetyltransferase [Nocardia sp. NPDC051463]|uniref:GNAT family N-acetyltransferase n=1 Tax=Nocardia sp. NPDC051463 TaxID=3154845 RepID=UPI00344CE263
MTLTTSDTRPPEWDSLAASTADFEVSSRWLETMAPLLPGEPRWLIAHAGGRAQIGLHLRFARTPPAEPRYDIAAILRGDIPSLDQRPILLSKTPGVESLYPAVLAVLPGYTCIPAGPGATDPALLAATLRATDAWARQQGARSVSFLYVPEREKILRRALEEFGARPVQLFPTCVMPVTFDSMDEYLMRLGRSRRAGLRRLLRWVDETGMTLGEQDLSEVREEVLELRMSLLRRYHHSADDQDAQLATIDRIVRNYPPEDRALTTLRRGDQIIGFTLGLRHGDMLRGLWSGQLPEARGAYFLLVFYGEVEAALRRGLTSINYGTLQWQEKTSFGCRLEQLVGHTWSL